MQALTYFFNEAIASLWRGRRSASLSIVTIGAAMAVLGGFLLATTNLERLLSRWTAGAELSVYLRDGISPDDQAAIDRLLTESTSVTGRQYVSKEDALARFRRDFPDLAPAAQGLPDNPFPASFEVRLRSESAADRTAERLADRLAKADGVADVRFDRQWIDRLMQVIAIVKAVGVVLGAVLLVAAGLTVASVVRLALHARRDEIEILELVGAPLPYIRGPFVMEGILQGGLGALLAIVFLWGVFAFVQARYLPRAAALLDVSLVQFLPLAHTFLLLVGGMALGCVGGFVAFRRAH